MESVIGVFWHLNILEKYLSELFYLYFCFYDVRVMQLSWYSFIHNWHENLDTFYNNMIPPPLSQTGLRMAYNFNLSFVDARVLSEDLRHIKCKITLVVVLCFVDKDIWIKSSGLQSPYLFISLNEENMLQT